MDGRKQVLVSICIISATISSLSETWTVHALDTETCEDIQPYIQKQHGNNGYYGRWCGYWLSRYADGRTLWYNMTFWGGHSQIPSKDDIDYKCFVSSVNGLIVLLGKHPDIKHIDESVVIYEVCGLNRDGACEWNLDVKMRKCNGDLLYSFHGYDPNNDDTWGNCICFDRIHTDTCSDTTMLYSAGNVEGNFIRFSTGDIQNGWYNGYVNGKQYVFPSTEDLDTLFDKYSFRWANILQEPIQRTIQETPVRLDLCYAYNFFYDSYGVLSYTLDTDDEGNCYSYIYVRACNGKLQFEISFMQYWDLSGLCFIHENNVVVKPEIKHNINYIEIDGETRKEYSPFLQYRCSFNMSKDTTYKTNWYINDTLMTQAGPSSQLEDLVFKEEYLNDLLSGYKVQCGVTATPENQFSESLSDVFYAGWKVSDSSIALSKSDSVFLELEQTIPSGCFYTDNETPACSDELSFVDPSSVPDVCAGSIRVQDAEDASKSYIEIKSLKEGEEWTNKKYRVKFTTMDNDYDDRTTFDLEMSLTRSTGYANGRAVRNEIVGAVHVDVTDINRHWNKKCYSHVDPHHKTQDGQHFEMQREGDHMLYLNEAHKTEIQQSARYCSPKWPGGPVCACGIAIRVGADAFVIDRCPYRNFTFDFVQCGDGGIIDIEKIHDRRYMVRTPTGTIVDIFLNTWGNTMNIDIYMSAKDFRNVVGLCGYFDGDRSNDLLHRDGVTVSDDSNRSYKFSDSWKLTDTENLFINKNRSLEAWNVATGGVPSQPCSRPNSITRKKCLVQYRKRRSVRDRSGKELGGQYLPLTPSSRTKRSSEIFTEEEAFGICNHSIYSTPAVKEFLDKLAEENIDVVVQQCVYDLTIGNDTAWAEVHSIGLNNAADVILRLNPVYVANNSEIVEAFLSETCLNNCSGNGTCESGICNCFDTSRGADCSSDISIPPLVYGVVGGEICEISESEDCSCFEIRGDNIFDGFLCNITKYKLYFNGTKDLESTSKVTGDYKDVFTGECCDIPERKKRSDDEDELYVIMYDFALSNDGNNFGETNSVYVYDSTCLQENQINGKTTIDIKDGFCFIDDMCVFPNSKVLTIDGCYLCNPTVNQYQWTKGDCDETNKPKLTIAAVTGIVTGSILVGGTVILVVIYLLCCSGANRHRVTIVQDIRSTSAAKPTSRMTAWATTLPDRKQFGEEMEQKRSNGPSKDEFWDF